ncbi:MAG: tetratricopeptide repeat protein, partial [Proteobacteria bacterium]|nr:tetratricopeptide repeat protein [Pseudomonadota bacterium]
RVAQIESGKPSAASSADDLWRLATSAFEAGRYNDAVDIFKRLAQTYPTHDKADDATYFRGQSYGHLKDWDHAIGAYQNLYDKWPESTLADDGLYMAGLAAKELKNCTEGRTYLAIVKSKYPKSNVAKQAADLEAELKKNAKDKTKCTS